MCRRPKNTCAMIQRDKNSQDPSLVAYALQISVNATTASRRSGHPAVAQRRRSCLLGDRITNRSNDLLDRPSVENFKRMNNLSHRFCVAPMMDWTDRHCRYFLRLISRHARLYTEMITAPALLHGDVPRHLDFDRSRASGRVAAGRQRSDDARARRAAGRAMGLRRDQPQLRLSVRARADRQLRRVPDGRPATGRGLRQGDVRCGERSRDGQAPHRPRRRRRLRIRPRFRRHGRRGRLRRVHRARAQRGAQGIVAEGESRSAAAALRRRASAEARLPAR